MFAKTLEIHGSYHVYNNAIFIFFQKKREHDDKNYSKEKGKSQ